MKLISSLTCISHHPTVEAHDKKAVIRVSCLVIRIKPVGRAWGCSPWSRRRDRGKPCCEIRVSSLVKNLEGHVARAKRLAPFSSARLAPSPEGPLTHFASPLGEKCRLTARVKSHAGGVTRPGTIGVTPSRARNVAPRSPRGRAEAARNPSGDGHFFVPTAVLSLLPSATTKTTA